MKKMRKSHVWYAILETRCPYCGYYYRYNLQPKEHIELLCMNRQCTKIFKLGKRKKQEPFRYITGKN